MKYYELEPEVAGGMGDMTEIVYEGYKMKEVTFLHYEFFGWLGDELLTTNRCFIVSDSLMNDIISSGLEGVEFRNIKMSFSMEYFSLFEKETVPRFVEFKCKFVYEENINNVSCDFYLSKYGKMIVSEKALSVLKQHQLDICKIKPID